MLPVQIETLGCLCSRLAFLPIYFTAYDTGRHQVFSIPSSQRKPLLQPAFFLQVHITTLCITISLSATVALACLFSPKVYIILVHPEKNMRLTKQLRAQASSFKFASQLANTAEFSSNHRPAHLDVSSSDGQSKSVMSNDQDENSQPLVTNLTVRFKNVSAPCETTMTKTKTPRPVAPVRSENGLTEENRKLSMEKSSLDDDASAK